MGVVGEISPGFRGSGGGYVESDSVIIFRVILSRLIFRFFSFNEVDLLFNTVIFVGIVFFVGKNEVIDFLSSSFRSNSTGVGNIFILDFSRFVES